MKFKWILLAIVLSLAVSCATTVPNGKGSENTPGPAKLLFWFYEDGLNHLSGVRTSQCPMYPSDSAYSRQAFKKHGFLVGWMMSIDRLMRCGRDETKLAPKVLVDGKWKYYDPLEWNDNWWDKK